MSWLAQSTATSYRPAADDPVRQVDRRAAILYLRSYLLMRAVIGFIGVALPVALLLGDGFLFRGVLPSRGSLSAYYYSGMRDVFVGALCVAGVFLITYRVFEHSLDNILSVIAGVAALGVALFCTSRPGGLDVPLNPLQERLGETPVATVHYLSAAVFILSLAVISFLFGVREGRREQTRPGYRARFSPEFWRMFHWYCAAVIVAAVLFMVVLTLGHWFTRYDLIIGESLAVLAFGLSWLMKGLELKALVAPQAAEGALREAAAVSNKPA